MIVVDSSVWIDFLQSAHSPHQDHLTELIRWPGVVGIPGPVIQEVLQGIRGEEHFQRVKEDLLRFPIIHADTTTYVEGARLYRRLASKGTVTPPGDVTIAALTIQCHGELYTLDQRHFRPIAQHSTLRLYQVPRSA